MSAHLPNNETPGMSQSPSPAMPPDDDEISLLAFLMILAKRKGFVGVRV